jgi:hypothetical protein
MARKLFVLALFLLAATIGVLGFQVFYYLKVGTWQSVPVQEVWDTLFGTLPIAQWAPLHGVWHWLGGLPVTVAGITAAYLVFLASDTLRRR